MRSIRKKIVKSGIIFLLVMLCMGINGVCSYAEKEEAVELQCVVKWQGSACYGVYTGEVRKGKPDGQGEFVGNIVIHNEKKEKIEYSGEWSDGKMDGQGKLTDYGRQKVYEGEFGENKLKGRIKEYSTDKDKSQNYVKKLYNQDIPYGVCWEYDKEKIVGYDRYYYGISVNQICEDAEEYIYADYIYHALSEEYRKVKLRCTVKEIAYNIEEEKNTVRVEDESGNSYMLNYDMTYKYVSRNYMPFLRRGDRITVFGYYSGFDVYDDGMEYPFIDAVTAIKENKKALDISNLDGEYSDLLDYPYMYYNKVVRLTGSPGEVYKVNEEWVFFYFEAVTKNKKRGTYICKVKNKEKHIKDFLVQDKEIAIRGRLRLVTGREADNGEYDIFPVIEVKKVITGE